MWWPSSCATSYGFGVFPAVMKHIDSLIFSCLIPSMGKGSPLKWWLSKVEGVVHSLGVMISQPLLQISYPIHSPYHY